MEIDDEPVIIEPDAGPSTANVAIKEKAKKKNLPW